MGDENDNDLIPCKYSSSGCRVKLCPGTIEEVDHYENCDYRPLKCLYSDCHEEIPYYAFLVHLSSKHFQNSLNSPKPLIPVILRSSEFENDILYTPKWIYKKEKHFFLMLSRKVPGIWSCWVWMLGTSAEADDFLTRITLFKKNFAAYGIFPVHPLRRSQWEIEESRTCILLDDQTIRDLTSIHNNILSDFTIKVEISKAVEGVLFRSIPSTTEINFLGINLEHLELEGNSVDGEDSEMSEQPRSSESSIDDS